MLTEVCACVRIPLPSANNNTLSQVSVIVQTALDTERL